MPERLPPDLSPKQRKLVLGYRDRGRTVKQVLAACDATGDEMYAALAKAGEPFRRPASARPGRVARRRRGLPRSRLLGIVGNPADWPADEPLDRRLERLLSVRIADMEDAFASDRDADPESTAKALALNVRTLAALRRVAAGPDDDAPNNPNEPPPRSLSQLRDDLKGHLIRLRVESRDRRRRERAEPHPG